MPELPEVETVRDGLARHAVGRTVDHVEVRRSSVARRQAGGPQELVARLAGRTLVAAVRRGKYVWLPLDGSDEALLVHLGMSGQVLVRGEHAEHPHLRARLHLVPGGQGGPVALDFVDQRTFGSLTVVDLLPTPDGAPGGAGSPLARVPDPVAHIARDLLDPAVDLPGLVRRIRSSTSGIKRVLLDQTVVSGIGNIYADEALWRSRVHFARPAHTLRAGRVAALLEDAADVMRAALRVGGTSFDTLYVDVNGRSGYFDRTLAVYGQGGSPCRRCGATVVREPFMNRSSFRCPRCQPAPRTTSSPGRGSSAAGRRAGGTAGRPAPTA